MDDKLKIYSVRCRCFFARLKEYFWEETIPLHLEFCNSGNEFVPFKEKNNGSFLPATEGTRWGEAWDNAWFHVTAELPETWHDKEIVMYFNVGGEALIFDQSGVPHYSFSVSSIFDAHYRREFFPVSEQFCRDGQLDIWIEAAANQLFGMYMNEFPALDESHPHGMIDPVVKKARVGIFRKEIWDLRLDMEILLGLTDSLPENDYRRKKIFKIMNDAVNCFSDNPDNAAAAREVLKKAMLPASAGAMNVTAVGHAHLDTGWLWRVRESIRKSARTFANQIYNIEKYPSYIFGASQAQHYQFVKDHYPELFEKIKSAVRAGRWEIQGGMWVECDCNLTSGESLIRQFIHGKNFFRDEFGVDVRNVWIPDVFGYSASMPQICRLAGCDFFLTQKISWNDVNRFPYNTFMWEGIDGSELLTHFPPEDCYLAELNPNQLVPAQNRYNENMISDEFISLFGIGNGGGGPKQEYIERGLRLADLEGAPKVKFGKAQDAFERMKKLIPQLEHWRGELYLELHRGTYTSQAKVKKRNRQLEQLLTATEKFLVGSGRNGDLDRAWKLLLLNQFHDILPGSSITEVYQDTTVDHDEIEKICRDLIPEINKTDDKAALINTLNSRWYGILSPGEWDGAEVVSGDGKIICQQIVGGKLQLLADLPADSKTVIIRKNTAAAAVYQDTQELFLENTIMRCEFNSCGELLRVLDKRTGSELIRQGEKGNVFSIYADRPSLYEAWDIDPEYKKCQTGKVTPTAAPQKLSAPAGDSLLFKLRIGNSILDMQVSLNENSPLLQFDCHISWHENRRMLRTAFTADVNAPEAISDIQYGYSRRPTHKNTSWEHAKFEMLQQRYTCLQDQRQGFALINDCKYGIAVTPSSIDLALLRSSKYPDWDADQGEHTFRYAFMPLRGEDKLMDVIDESAAFNREPLILSGDVNWELPVKLVSDNIRIEVVKKAEKGDAVIIRTVECAGEYSRGILSSAKGTIADCDLLEWNIGAKHGNNYSFEMHPFEIRTFVLLPAGS